MSKPADAEKIWWQTLLRWWKRLAIFAGIVALWIVLTTTGIVPPGIESAGVFIVALLLFVLALPISLLFRLDQVAVQHGYENSTTTLVIGLVFVTANFTLLGALHGGLRQLKSRMAENVEDDGQSESRSRLNGTGDDSEPH